MASIGCPCLACIESSSQKPNDSPPLICIQKRVQSLPAAFQEISQVTQAFKWFLWHGVTVSRSRNLLKLDGSLQLWLHALPSLQVWKGKSSMNGASPCWPFGSKSGWLWNQAKFKWSYIINILKSWLRNALSSSRSCEFRILMSMAGSQNQVDSAWKRWSDDPQCLLQNRILTFSWASEPDAYGQTCSPKFYYRVLYRSGSSLATLLHRTNACNAFSLLLLSSILRSSRKPQATMSSHVQICSEEWLMKGTASVFSVVSAPAKFGTKTIYCFLRIGGPGDLQNESSGDTVTPSSKEKTYFFKDQIIRIERECRLCRFA